MEWTTVADLGEADGGDFTLGRCSVCRAWLMDVFYGESGTINVLSDELGLRFDGLRGRQPELKAALKGWFGA
jgi:hypothetical protein